MIWLSTRVDAAYYFFKQNKQWTGKTNQDSAPPLFYTPGFFNEYLQKQEYCFAFSVQLWRIDINEELKCKADGLEPLWVGINEKKFEAGALNPLPDAQGNLQAIIILNKASPPKELFLQVTELEVKEPEVGKIVNMKKVSEDEDATNRNKWISTKHHIEGEDWFTLKNEAYGYFLTCPKKAEITKELIVSYEVPGMYSDDILSVT